jgi:serine/threonine protein kinase
MCCQAFTSRVICRYGCDILSGLVKLHSCSVIVTDLQPHNVYLTDDGQAVLAHFGQSQADNAGVTVQLASARAADWSTCSVLLCGSMSAQANRTTIAAAF